MPNFKNIRYKTKLEVKVSSLENENFELRGQLIDNKTTYNKTAKN